MSAREHTKVFNYCHYSELSVLSFLVMTRLVVNGCTNVFCGVPLGDGMQLGWAFGGVALPLRFLL